MKTLIVYDSIFGNTERIAQALGAVLGGEESAVTLRVSEVKPEHLTGLGSLIVGSPTRAFRPTKAIDAFLKGIPANGLKGVKVTAFDTRMSLADVQSKLLKRLAKVFGYAAKPISDKLVKKGGSLTAPPEGFFVKDSEGPLKDGELERAAEWVKRSI